MRVNLEQAIAKLKRGEVVAIPTETVYGLAADASNENALQQIYAIKERPANNPLIVHIATKAQVGDWAAEFSPLAQKLAHAFWPGAFTLVLPAKPEVLKIVRAGESTVALRIPEHAMTQQVLKESGLGLAAPSANKSTQLSPTTASHVAHGLGEHVPVLDGGACKIGIESTIVAVEGDEWRLLRLGMIGEAAIALVAGKPANKNKQATPRAPGQHLLHYSPITPIKLFDSKSDLIDFATTHKGCVALMIGDGEIASGKTFNLPNNPHTLAEKLYDTLHQMDALNAALLLIEAPPNQTEWLAIKDRLSRASHKTL
ncbi:MAG: threonylcarbamoyl-AMP synthase [Methylophilaceae bacterium]|nr:MAG: threonylcarbamoyl-AMP synthase [Methylophilaceae bacterium]